MTIKHPFLYLGVVIINRISGSLAARPHLVTKLLSLLFAVTFTLSVILFISRLDDLEEETWRKKVFGWPVVLGKRIMQALVFVGTWVAWDLYVKDWFLDLVSGETPGLAEIFLAYLTPFILAFVLSALVVKLMGLNQERGDGYE